MARPKGFKHSAETKQKMSAAWKKRSPPSLETREKLRLAQLGKIVSADTRKKMSDAQKGHIVSSETRLKMSDSLKGRPRSEETRKKISLAHTGKIRTPEHIKKLAEANRGKHGGTRSEETRKKISAALKGRKRPGAATPQKIIKKRSPPSVETRQRIGSSLLGHPTQQITRERISKSLKGRFVGERSPHWKGGISYEPYCPKFNEDFKERVRAFFGYTCQFPGCGHVWQPGEKKLAVHHVNYRKDSCCDSSIPRLFVPVCAGKCHGKTGRNREVWENYFTELIMGKYKGQCYIPDDSRNRDDGIS